MSSQKWTWGGNPLHLPSVGRDSIPTVTGDRRAGAQQFCAGCGSSLEGGLVTRGFWTYCSIECAIRTERADGRHPR